jgi:hypothetical protein
MFTKRFVNAVFAVILFGWAPLAFTQVLEEVVVTAQIREPSRCANFRISYFWRRYC